MYRGSPANKTKILPDNAYITMSKLETWVFVPAMNFSNMVKNFTVNNFAENSTARSVFYTPRCFSV